MPSIQLTDNCNPADQSAWLDEHAQPLLLGRSRKSHPSEMNQTRLLRPCHHLQVQPRLTQLLRTAIWQLRWRIANVRSDPSTSRTSLSFQTEETKTRQRSCHMLNALAPKAPLYAWLPKVWQLPVVRTPSTVHLGLQSPWRKRYVTEGAPHATLTRRSVPD